MSPRPHHCVTDGVPAANSKTTSTSATTAATTTTIAATTTSTTIAATTTTTKIVRIEIDLVNFNLFVYRDYVDFEDRPVSGSEMR